MMKNILLLSILLSFGLNSCAQDAKMTKKAAAATEKPNPDKVVKTEQEWKQTLTPEQYYVLREQGTELAFSGEYHNHKGKGVYTCAGCGNELFNSKTKFRSGTGWPSFYEPVSKVKVGIKEDRSFGMVREEVYCSKCDGHLGHVFNDGPQPTGLRYCINSVSLNFESK